MDTQVIEKNAVTPFEFPVEFQKSYQKKDEFHVVGYATDDVEMFGRGVDDGYHAADIVLAAEGRRADAQAPPPVIAGHKI